MAEPAYAFRKRLAVVHAPDWRDPAVLPGHADAVVGEGWSVVVARDASALLLGVAQDLQDYLLISMGVSVLLRRVEDIAAATQPGSQSVVLATTRELPEEGATLTVARSYRLRSTADLIVICGFDERGAAQGSYFLEDQMNLRAAPFLAPADVQRQPLFSPRMIHSGWGLDEFPDAHLNAIAHAGLDAILLFVTGVDRTPDEHTHRDGLHGTGRHRDIGDLIDRAAHYGLDVYLYSYLRSEKALSDPDAEAYYDSTYGALFQAYPQVKGVILVGESVEFPSSDPRTTRRLRLTPSPDGLPADKPSPGWWPCTDYPEWLTLLKRVIRRHAPNAEIVFWTYNWGYAPEADRLALIRRLPEDI
ncbi:MAG TPA: hypothetical protein VGP33_01505, partial [Chloroflexota bacterium]|nr:hypothetical protein [Chloroflexota bacterium]